MEAEARHDLALFFRKNPGFELGRELVGAYLEEGGGAILTDIDPNNIPRLKEQLLPLERIVKVAKRPDDMHVLLSEGFDSAYKIVNLGRRDFHAVLADRLDGDTARIEAIYNNAEQNVAMSLALIARYSQTYNNTAVAVVSTSAVTTTPAPDPARGIADMRTLFGNQDFCTCDDCRSVYSPAAYLVDLLYYLSKRKISNGQSLKDVLLARRPDVAEIELSCENTNTRLPYIDLVNEVLENAVAVRPAGSPYPQTSWSEEELSANPEHVNVKAYDDYLGSAFYPWTLPFNFWMKEARTYLEHLGVQRYQLMETVQPALRLTDYAVACESLGLTKENAELITASTANPPAPWQLWGFPTDQVQNFPDRRAGITRSGQWSDLLKIVSLFLQQSAITYTELLNLLQMRYITAQIAAGLSLLLQGDVCNPGTMEIAGLNPAILARIPRFVRLWRQLGWKMHDLDKAIAVFPGAEITEDLILWLSHIQRLRAYHNVTVVTVLSWWSNVDSFAYLDFTEGSPVPVVPLYHRLFLNRTVSTVSVPDLEIDPVTGDLKGTNKKITEYPAAVLAGLGISAADLALLFAKQVPSSTNPTQMVPLVPDKLTLKNLSTLYRIASLTRALGMSIRDWLVVTALTGLDPFADISNVAKGSDSSLATLKFVEEVTFIHASDFNALELDFLLRLQQSRTALVGPSVQQIASVLSDIRRGLREISIQTTVAADDTGERVKRGLALLAWPEQLAAELFSADLLSSSPRFVVPIARLPANLIPAALQGKLTYDAHSQQLVCLGALRQQERDDILNLLVDWTQPEYRAVKQAVEALYADAAQITPNRVKVAAARLQSFELPSFIVGWLTTDLASLPTGLTLPDDLPVELKALVSYDAGSQKLQFKGLMMATERAKLISLAGVDQSFIDAVERLFVPVNFPVELAEHFYYDRTARELRFVGWMTASQRQQLRGLTPATSFQDAVDDLFTQASRYQENTVANQFLTKSDVEQLFYDARSLPMRFELILQKLMPYLRIRLSRNLVVQQLAQALALEVQTVAELLTQPQRLVWPNHTDQAGQPEPAVMAFLDPTFANSSLNDSLTPIAFGDQFAMVTRISQVV
ncbi:MAG TPA: Tc toxin subunit A, partial [Caldilineaceae bacterium]|nr:Tc toxin subunit A [Caldilineaceae bacterium]